MFIVAGTLYVDPARRDAYLASCVEVVRAARSAPGCVDFAVSADLVEPGRINVYERWESDKQLLDFRGAGPDGEAGGDDPRRRGAQVPHLRRRGAVTGARAARGPTG